MKTKIEIIDEVQNEEMLKKIMHHLFVIDSGASHYPFEDLLLNKIAEGDTDVLRISLINNELNYKP